MLRSVGSGLGVNGVPAGQSLGLLGLGMVHGVGYSGLLECCMLASFVCFSACNLV